VLLVSHDRDFIDRVATSTVAMEGDGQVTVYPGGWSDYQAQRGEVMPEIVVQSKRSEPTLKQNIKPQEGLTFAERKRLEALPAVMARLEAEIARLAELLETPDLYGREPVKFRKASELMAERQTALLAAEAEWLALAEREG